MNNYLKEFTDEGHHDFRFKIGRLLASSLSGFIAGVIFSSIVWSVVIYLLDAFR